MLVGAMTFVLGVGVICASACGSSEITPPDVDVVDTSTQRVDTATYPEDGVVAYTGKQKVSGLGVRSDGVKYLQVDGRPFAYLGAQLRIDFFLQLDKYELSDLEYLIKLAASLNITCIQVPIAWSDIETSEGVYSSALIEKVMEYCNKYKLRLEILWFGSYMCGYTVADEGNLEDNKTGYVPNYIYANPDEYPTFGVFENGATFGYRGWLGWQYMLMPNTQKLIERESLAIEYLMNAIYNYDSTHGGRHTVIGVQVENEADMLINERPNELDMTKTYNALKNTLPENVTEENLLEYCDEQMAKHLNALGLVVKNSDYSCYTRTNITLRGDWETRANLYISEEGIDFIGVDPYCDSLTDIDSFIKTLDDIDGNFAHIAENGGEFYNNDLMQLTAFANHGGYSVFEVVCTSNTALVDWELRGVFRDLGDCRFQKKPQANRLISANKIIKDGHAVLANHEGMAVLNNMTHSGLPSAISSGKVAGLEFTCKTEDHGVGYVAAQGEYVYFASTQRDLFTFEGNYDFDQMEAGYFDSMGVWHVLRKVSCSNKMIRVQEEICYRVRKVN